MNELPEKNIRMADSQNEIYETDKQVGESLRVNHRWEMTEQEDKIDLLVKEAQARKENEDKRIEVIIRNLRQTYEKDIEGILDNHQRIIKDIRAEYLKVVEELTEYNCRVRKDLQAKRSDDRSEYDDQLADMQRKHNIKLREADNLRQEKEQMKDDHQKDMEYMEHLLETEIAERLQEHELYETERMRLMSRCDGDGIEIPVMTSYTNNSSLLKDLIVEEKMRQFNRSSWKQRPFLDARALRAKLMTSQRFVASEPVNTFRPVPSVTKQPPTPPMGRMSAPPLRKWTLDGWFT